MGVFDLELTAAAKIAGTVAETFWSVRVYRKITRVVLTKTCHDETEDPNKKLAMNRIKSNYVESRERIQQHACIFRTLL